MNYSHVENNLKFIVEYVKVITGEDLTKKDHDFFASVLNLSYGDGYRKAVEVGEEAGLKNKFNLTQQQFDLFLRVHRAHMKAMGSDNQLKYSLSNIRKLAWDEGEQTVNVYYDDEWWHYNKKGCWY